MLAAGNGMEMPEIDPNFEPQTRARSNTWPVRPKDLDGEEQEQSRTPNSEGDCIKEEPAEIDEELEEVSPTIKTEDPLGLNAKKGGSRRNAWGNLSYADLITKAITSSPEQRLTLSQIYEWMVQNVPYFRDKGDSNSSAGWKNSIRHNLSLHSRFVRVQNEGTGKSSWWVINPDGKPGKAPRRRATSMDTKAYEKKRGRVKKKVDALRAAMEAGGSLSNLTNDSFGSSHELSLSDNFNLSPQDFRQRTSSNASSIGRLSPIAAVIEPEQVPSMSPIQWNKGFNSNDGFTESISESLAELIVGEVGRDNSMSPNVQEQLVTSSTLSATSSPLNSQLSPNTNFQNSQNGSFLQAPPPYPEQLRQSPQPQGSPNMRQSSSPQPMMGRQGTSPNHMMRGMNVDNGMAGGSYSPEKGYVPQSLTELLNDNSPGSFQQDGFLRQVDEVMPSPPAHNVSLNQYPNNSSAFQHNPANQANNYQTVQGGGGMNYGPQNTQSQQQQKPRLQASQMTPQQRQQLISAALNNSLLRQALTQNQAILQKGNSTLQQLLSGSHQQQQQQQQQEGGTANGGSNGYTVSATTSGLQMAGGTLLSNNSCSMDTSPSTNVQQNISSQQQFQQQQQMQQGQNMGPMGHPQQGPNIPNDLDLNMTELSTVDFSGCDVDQILKHELTFNDELDFNFEQVHS